MVYGYRTGDIAKATVPTGKYKGITTGRVAIRSSGSFTIGDTVTHYRHLEKLFCSDGYQYQTTQLAKVILTTDTRIKKMYRSLIKTSYRVVTKELKKKVTLYTLQTNLNNY